MSSATASPTRVQSCSWEGREDPHSRELPGVGRGGGDGREAVEKPAALTLEGMGSAGCCERVAWSPGAGPAPKGTREHRPPGSLSWAGERWRSPGLRRHPPPGTPALLQGPGWELPGTLTWSNHSIPQGLSRRRYLSRSPLGTRFPYTGLLKTQKVGFLICSLR